MKGTLTMGMGHWAIVQLARSLDSVRESFDLRAERGVAMAEYGMLLALVAVVAITVIAAFGNEIVNVFSEAQGGLATRGEVPIEG